MLHRLCVQQVYTAVLNPTGNSPVERLVKTLKTMLKRMVASQAAAWPSVLPQAKAVYMRRVHSANGVSPMQMLTGKSEPDLVPLGSLLPEVDVAALFLDPISLPAMHIREETDDILPTDVS